MAAKAMGLAEVPTIYIPGLSEAQKRALRIADNKIALGAGWDLDVLKMELAELGSLDLDFDLSVTGFSTGELDVILNGSTDPDDEVIPEMPASPRTRLGDIWILGPSDPDPIEMIVRSIVDPGTTSAADLIPRFGGSNSAT
jgi:ParB-like chromosome segregation protein Spo0J